MWGQDYCYGQSMPFPRIIPTRVGTSSQRKKKRNYFKDHPHACGDKSELVDEMMKMEGSSPRVWGQGLRRGEILNLHRIIPTRVGTRVKSYYTSFMFEDHPHACGDKR